MLRCRCAAAGQDDAVNLAAGHAHASWSQLCSTSVLLLLPTMHCLLVRLQAR